jgi:hypothetical protein
MAKLKKVSMEGNDILISLEVAHDEYKLLGSEKDFLVVPKGDNFLSLSLTTGKLGHGNRIMVPTRLLRRHDIMLPKKVPASLFEAGGEKYLLIKLQKSRLIPEYEE